MKNIDERDQQREVPRNRLSQLSEASLRINESLDFDTVLQEILDSARSLTDARCGVIVTLDDKGQVEDFLASGLTGRGDPTGIGDARGAKDLRIPNHYSGTAERPGLCQLH